MKLKDVVVGETYLTQVSGCLVEVIVVRESRDYLSRRVKFILKRKDNGQPLPKHRPPAALHPITKQP
jgi:hypothetical protein